MAKRTNSLIQSSVLTVNKEEFEQQLNERIKIGEIIYKQQIQSQEQFENTEEEYINWDDYNLELLKQSFNIPNNEYRDDYERVNDAPFYISTSSYVDEIKELKDDIRSKTNYLKQLVNKLPLIKSEIQNTSEVSTIKDTKKVNDNVFIVHGHNNEIKINVARTIEKLGLKPIILHEQPNEGKTIIEKFEEHSSVGFAIVLLTNDDLGKSKKDDNLNSRARQNVILELGYFIGKLGRNRVCPLYTKGVELPSDLYGLLYTELDQADSWKFALAKELKTAGYIIDVNNLL